MIIVQLKEGENIERALKKFKRKFEKTGVVKELRAASRMLSHHKKDVKWLSVPFIYNSFSKLKNNSFYFSGRIIPGPATQIQLMHHNSSYEAG